jgi:hypothetical protein
MRATTVVERWISLAAELIETPRLIATRESLLSNIKATNDFIMQLITRNYVSDIDYGTNKEVFTHVPKELLADFVGSFLSHPRHISFSAKDLSHYIRMSTKLLTWDVAILGGSGGRIMQTDYFDQKIIDLNLNYASRVMRTVDNCLLISGERARVGVPGATKYGLSLKRIEEIEQAYKDEHGNKTTIPDKPYLRVQRRPVLLIYVMQIGVDSDDASIDLVKNLPVIGLGLGFPGTYNDESMKAKYVLNRVEEKNQLQFEEDDEYDEN